MKPEDKKKDSKKKDESIPSPAKIKKLVDLHPTIKEGSSQHAVVTFGRMNPPTVGHQKLVDKIKTLAKRQGAMAHVYLSHSHDSKKNPLKYDTKIALAKKAFGSDIVVKSSARNPIEIMKELERMGHSMVTFVVGSDRVSDFKRMLLKYNGKDFNFDSIQVVSAGERDPDAEGVEGMSASKMRAAAAAGDFATFKMGLPKKLQGQAKAIMSKLTEEREEYSGYELTEEEFEALETKAIKSGVPIDSLVELYVYGRFNPHGSQTPEQGGFARIAQKINESQNWDYLDEEDLIDLIPMSELLEALEEETQAEDELNERVLSLLQRRKTAMRMKRRKSIMKRKRDIQKKRMANTGKLKQRSRRAAIRALRKRVGGAKGQKYATLTPSEKVAIDKRMQSKLHLVDRIAKRLLPKVKKQEMTRLKRMRTKKEAVNNFAASLVELTEGQFNSHDDAHTYAVKKAKQLRDPQDGVEIHKHSDGSHSVNNTMNWQGREALKKQGAKHVKTIYGKDARKMKEETDGVNIASDSVDGVDISHEKKKDSRRKSLRRREQEQDILDELTRGSPGSDYNVRKEAVGRNDPETQRLVTQHDRERDTLRKRHQRERLTLQQRRLNRSDDQRRVREENLIDTVDDILMQFEVNDLFEMRAEKIKVEKQKVRSSARHMPTRAMKDRSKYSRKGKDRYGDRREEAEDEDSLNISEVRKIKHPKLGYVSQDDIDAHAKAGKARHEWSWHANRGDGKDEFKCKHCFATKMTKNGRKVYR